ncbi:hypothetical protein TNCV_1937611, partial [Trichonephila clavipes]
MDWRGRGILQHTAPAVPAANAHVTFGPTDLKSTFSEYSEGIWWPRVQWHDSPRGPRPTVPNSVCVTLVPEVHEQMFRSGGQSDVKPPVLSSQASLSVISFMHTSSFNGVVPRSNSAGSRHVERLTTGKLPMRS